MGSQNFTTRVIFALIKYFNNAAAGQKTLIQGAKKELKMEHALCILDYNLSVVVYKTDVFLYFLLTENVLTNSQLTKNSLKRRSYFVIIEYL